MIKRENYLSQIRPFIGITELIKVIVGVRRSGKSIMLELIKQELLASGVSEAQMISVNFEDMAYASLTDGVALHAYLKDRADKIDGRVYIFLDEIQEVENWEKCVNSLRIDPGADIYITGSNAKLLSGELATYLAGRYVEFVIYPFSFSEFIELYNTIQPNTSEADCFKKYLHFGGMPYLAALQYNEAACKQYLQDVYTSVELKDIVRRNNIRDVDMLERILTYITANIGTIFSANVLSKYLKSEGRSMATETIINYVKACTDAFLFYQVKRQDIQGKKLLAINEKYYVADHGIREAVFGGNMKDINLILENIVYLELLRRGYKVSIGKLDTKEIDFICEKQDKKIYIQVTYLLAAEETIQREFGFYNEITDNYPKYVLSLDEFDMSRNGIIHKNIRDFLTDASI